MDDLVIEIVEHAGLDLLHKLGSDRAASCSLLRNQHAVGSPNAPFYRLPVETGRVEGSEIDDLRIDTAIEGSFASLIYHAGPSKDSAGRTGTNDSSFAKRDAEIQIVERNQTFFLEELHTLDHKHRIIATKSRIHQSDVVERSCRGHNPPTGEQSEQSSRVAGVL